MSDAPGGVFLIGCGAADVPAPLERLGFKAWNLARMARLGMQVPPAFVLDTGFCRQFIAGGGVLPPGTRDLLAASVRQLEAASGLVLGSSRRPLLVSVRSGAAVSMPGMMETVLDIGLCDATVSGLLRLSGNPRLAWDSYRRLIQGFGEVVKHIDPKAFSAALDAELVEARVSRVEQLDFRSLRALTATFREIYQDHVGEPFPQSPLDQLEAATAAVFASWQADKARAYRRANGIPESLGTAVTVQQMVFGNSGGTSGAGVGFTRDPATGERRLYLDFAPNAQGEDVVSGRAAFAHGDELSQLLPEIHAELLRTGDRLESEFGDAQEFEFTVQDGRLFMLQTRNAKRTPLAALRIAVELFDDGVLSRDQALALLRDVDTSLIFVESIESADAGEPLASGVAASVGVVSGRLAFDPGRARALAATGVPVILAREDIATSDIEGIQVAAGILTSRGGRTSHAAVIARQLGRACIVGCAALRVDPDARCCTIGSRRCVEGEMICLDADSGRVFAGERRVARVRPVALLERIEAWQAARAAGKADSRRAAGNQNV